MEGSVEPVIGLAGWRRREQARRAAGLLTAASGKPRSVRIGFQEEAAEARRHVNVIVRMQLRAGRRSRV